MTLLICAVNELGHPASLLDSARSIFANASFIATDVDGRLAITDADANKVWVVSPDGEVAFCLEAEFHHPHGVAFDDESRILVADRKGHSIRVFDRHGAHLRDFGPQDGGSTFGPLGIAIAPDGTILVAEDSGGSVQAFDPDGASRWIHDGFGCPTALAVDAKHNTLWVADWTKDTVTGFEFVDKEHLRPCHTLTGFWRPHGLAVDSRGLLHVSDGKGYYIYERVTDDDGTDVYLRILEDPRFKSPPFASGIAEARDGSILVCHGPRVAVVPPMQLAERSPETNASCFACGVLH